MEIKYKPNEVEPKWQKIWNESKVYSPNLDTAKKPFYNLMMFPYPSAEGMHVGNMYAFTGADVYGRFMRMLGNDVFEPMGLDGFGIHSENYAIKVGKHPKEQAKVSEANFYRQLRATGNGFDWSRKLETYDPSYYKWTQWLFIQLFKAGLAYRKKAAVNFCPKDKTVLADEQVIDGKCERCDSVIEKRDLEQWFFKITKYADRLLANIAKLDWSEKVKIAQRQWIGKSEGAKIRFTVIASEAKQSQINGIATSPLQGLRPTAPRNDKFFVEVFTTRPDTLYGATFLVLAPEHRISKSIKDGKVQEYIKQAKGKTEQERMAEGKEKTGVFSGLYAINPLNQEKIPVWIADYALMGYGTGAIMAVPAHDQRDFEFAKKYNLPIKNVIASETRQSQTNGIAAAPSEPRNDIEKAYTGYGILIDSGEFSGLTSQEAKKRVTAWLKDHKFGGPEITYHLRDWLISRQRYWGPPIPMIYCDKCKWQAVPEKDLPVLLPDVKDWKPKGTASNAASTVKSPLANHPEFYKTECPNCKREAKRETDVSDTFLDSAWYFLRYVSTDIESVAFDIERVKKWLPVAMYIGGAEHSVLHLLYSRFITMVLKDLGFIDFEEPFSRFYAHGLLVKEGAKMSKSKGNVVIPDEYIKKYGADTLRMYLMFLGPFNQGGDFYDTGIEGMFRFVKRVWRLIVQQFVIASEAKQSQINGIATSPLQSLRPTAPRNDMVREVMMHKTIKKVTEDIEHLRYNTAISALMEWYNFLMSNVKSQMSKVTQEEAETFLKLLAPFASHVTEELWSRIIADQNAEKRRSASISVYDQPKSAQWSIHCQPWPGYNPKFLVEDEVTIVVQVNGKMRDTIKVQSAKCKVQSYVEELVRKSDKVSKYLEGKEIKKVVYVEGKIINFVVE